jgi:hypothetical protein
MLNRRELIQSALATGALPALSGGGERVARPEPVQDQPIVVEGLFAGAIRLSHLRGMQQGGVHCGVAGGPSDMGSFSALLKFFDQYKAEVVHAKSVADIRRARREGKIANVFCWQSADALGAAFNSPSARSRRSGSESSGSATTSPTRSGPAASSRPSG